MSAVVDVAEILLNVAGWIVAGGVTLAGILVAHALQERSRARQEDRVAVYEPLRREMETVLADEDAISYGGYVWSMSEAYRDLNRRGALRPRRHNPLRGDVDELESLQRTVSTAYHEFYRARETANQTVLGEGRVRSPETSQELSLTEALSAGPTHHLLLSTLAEGDREGWIRGLRTQGTRGNIQLDWDSIRPGLEELFGRATELVEAARRAYVTSAEALLNHARVVRVGLDAAIEHGSTYRSARTESHRA